MKKLLVLALLSGCLAEAPEVESVEEPLIVLGCSQKNLTRSALTSITSIFWGFKSECREIPLAYGFTGYECGLGEAYIPDRDRPGYDRAIDRFYTRVIPLGPTLNTSVVYQFDQCGDGRANAPEGQGARSPLDSSCWQAGSVTCKCGQPCTIDWY